MVSGQLLPGNTELDDELAGRLVDQNKHRIRRSGRDYDSIEKTVLVRRPALADVDAFVADVAEYAALVS